MKKQTLFYSSPGRTLPNHGEMRELRVETITGSACCALTVLSPQDCLERTMICAQHCIFLAHELFVTLYNSSIQLYLKVVFVLFFVEFIGLTWKLMDFSYLSKCDAFFFLRTMKQDSCNSDWPHEDEYLLLKIYFPQRRQHHTFFFFFLPSDWCFNGSWELPF